MLDHRGDDVLVLAGFRADQAENTEIVGFGAARGENDIAGLRSEKRGHLSARVFHGAAAALAVGMNRAGVAEFSGQIRQHGREDRRIYGRGRVVVKVDVRHKSRCSRE